MLEVSRRSWRTKALLLPGVDSDTVLDDDVESSPAEITLAD